MRGTLLVAAREVVERRSVLIAALVAGLLPFASPLLPGVKMEQAAEARDGMALVLAAAFSLGVALLLGATVVARDLAEGRLGFDFSRPMGGGTIWAGRFLGALVVTLLVLAVVVLPATAVGGGVSSPQFRDLVRPGSLALLAALLFLLPLAHTVSIAFRSRSVWLVVDLVAMLVVLLSTGVAARRLFDAFAIEDLTWSLLVLGVLAIPAFWIASAVQVACGRTDVRRGHRLQSSALWGALLATSLAFGGYARWVLAAGPEDLTSAYGDPAPRGSWLVVSGEARGRGDYTPAFLIDAASGRAVKLGALKPWIGPGVVFSGDGRRAAWLRPGGPKDLRLDTLLVDLDHPEAGPRDTRIVFPDPWLPVALSEDGHRMAALEGPILSVYDLDSGALLASAKLAERLERGFRPLVLFAGRDRARVYVFQHGIQIYELDVRAKKLERTGSTVGVDSSRACWDRVHDRLLLRDPSPKGPAVLLDGRSGATLATFSPTGGQSERHSFRFLADGRVAFVERERDRSWIRIVPGSGEDQDRIDLDTEEDVSLGGEVSPGVLVIAEADRRLAGSAAARGSRVLLLDLASKEVRETGRGLFPVLAMPWRQFVEAPMPGSAATKLFETEHAVVYFDPLTGGRRVLAGTLD